MQKKNDEENMQPPLSPIWHVLLIKLKRYFSWKEQLFNIVWVNIVRPGTGGSQR